MAIMLIRISFGAVLFILNIHLPDKPIKGIQLKYQENNLSLDNILNRLNLYI
jgi:hypothetical protein